MTVRLTAGPVRDMRGAERRRPTLPAAPPLLADKGYDRDRGRAARPRRNRIPCIPGRGHRKHPIADDPELSKRPNHLERRFDRLKDWRRIATRYDRCAHPFFRAICLAAIVLFWL